MVIVTPRIIIAEDKKLGNGLFNRLAKSVNVIGIDRHDVPVLVGIEVLDRELLHTSKKLVP